MNTSPLAYARTLLSTISGLCTTLTSSAPKDVSTIAMSPMEKVAAYCSNPMESVSTPCPIAEESKRLQEWGMSVLIQAQRDARDNPTTYKVVIPNDLPAAGPLHPVAYGCDGGRSPRLCFRWVEGVLVQL